MKLKTLHQSLATADAIRAIYEDKNPLISALLDISVCEVPLALIGGIAVGFHAKPRATDDIDILIMSDQDIDAIVKKLHDKFTRNRPHALTHKVTDVEIELITPQLIGVNPQLIKQVIDTAQMETINGHKIPTATKEGLVALKLCRRSRQDAADIEAIIKSKGLIDLSGYNLTSEQLAYYKAIEKDTLNKE